MTTYGEQMPLEAQNQLAGCCGDCGGLMLPAADDPGHRKCSECSRSTFRPVSGAAQEPDRERGIHAPRGIFPARSTKGRDTGLPQVSLNAGVRRFR